MRGSAKRSLVTLYGLAGAFGLLACSGVPVHRFNAKKARPHGADAGVAASPPLDAGVPEPRPPPSPEPPDAGAAPQPTPPSETPVVEVPAGQAWVGHDPKDRTHLPRRLAKHAAFTIDRREVTASAYAACVRGGGCTATKMEGGCTARDASKAEHPINCVTWAQAAAYCAAGGARLPTELEWERAARGPNARQFPWGDAWPPPEKTGNFADEAARAATPYWTVLSGYSDGFAATAPVGSFPRGATPEGIHDLAGNVLEWTADVSSPGYRVVRGSSFGHAGKAEIAAYRRAGYRAEVSSIHIGFRCVR